VLVLAGDIGSYQEGGLLADTSFGLERFSPLPQFAGWPVPVLLVPGNHEYDAQDFDAAHHRLRTVLRRSSALRGWSAKRWCWTACVLLAPRSGATSMPWPDHENSTDLTRSLKLRDKAFRAANFYLRKTGATRAASPFWQSRCARRRCCASNGCVTLARPPRAHGGSDPLCTQPAQCRPTLWAGARHGRLLQCPGRQRLPLAQLWLHGHLHAPSDYLGSP
jgi:hypothetical protein